MYEEKISAVSRQIASVQKRGRARSWSQWAREAPIFWNSTGNIGSKR